MTLHRRLAELEPLLAGLPASLEFTSDAGEIVALLVPRTGAALAARASTLEGAVAALHDVVAARAAFPRSPAR